MLFTTVRCDFYPSGSGNNISIFHCLLLTVECFGLSENEVPAYLNAFLCYINQLLEYFSEVSAIFMPRFHTQSKKAYQLMTERYFTSQQLLFVRFAPHAQSAALELLLFKAQSSYQHKFTREGSRSVENVSFSVTFFFEIGIRCFLNPKVAGWRADRKNKRSQIHEA